MLKQERNAPAADHCSFLTMDCPSRIIWKIPLRSLSPTVHPGNGNFCREKREGGCIQLLCLSLLLKGTRELPDLNIYKQAELSRAPGQLQRCHFSPASSSQQPGKNKSHLGIPPSAKKTLLELRMWKGAKNWGSSKMIPAITSLVTDQKPEPFLAPRTHEVFRGWCSVEKLPGKHGWVLPADREIGFFTTMGH